MIMEYGAVKKDCRRGYLPRHSEPVRTLAWESVIPLRKENGFPHGMLRDATTYPASSAGYAADIPFKAAVCGLVRNDDANLMTSDRMGK